VSEPSSVSSGREAVIEFRNAGYQLPGGPRLLHEISFVVGRGETLVLLGRSGAGKTTALRLINRLVDPTDGEVLVEGRRTLDWDPIRLRRRVGYVIQETGLFPHYTVEKNISLLPRLEHWPKLEIRARVEELLRLVGLDPGLFLERYPRELSGGQRQRVGLARALASDPPILLMDEPFGALDPLTRADIRVEFQALERRLGKAIVLVTHDINDALVLGARIALIEAGELKGLYSPPEFLQSAEPVAAAYLGQLRALDLFRKEERR